MLVRETIHYFGVCGGVPIMSRRPRWCVAEISQDGKINPISPSFEYAVDAEERQKALSAKEEYRGKNLHVVKASHPVDPRGGKQYKSLA
jgi:hypothetical protein